MRDILEFLNNYYEKALELSNDFCLTRSCEWSPLLILNELSIQIGHVYNVIYKNKDVNENNRKFKNLGDEISDVLLQLIALADSLKIDMYNIEKMKMINENDLLSFPILFGQLNEAIMEKYEYRFSKDRKGFASIDDFIQDRIFKLFIITYNIAVKNDLDIEKEFSIMLEDATEFLKRFSRDLEYISIYDELHNFKGVCEKRKAHKLGYWHDVVGVMIFNPVTRNVYFQLKNHKHNNVNTKNLLEITAGGHLQAGEDINDCIREIKEETGIDVSFDQLIKVGCRECDMDNNMLIREFQHFFILPLEVDLKDFKEDGKETLGFVQINLEDALNILSFSLKPHGEVLIKRKNSIKSIKLSKNDFDEAFINNRLFDFLLSKINDYNNERLSKNKLSKDTKRKFNRIHSVIKLDKKLHSNDYYNARLLKSLEFYNNNIQYTVMKSLKSSKEFTVYTLIYYNKKMIIKQLSKNFDNNKQAEEYYKELCSFVKVNSNEKIINKCYEELKEFPRNFLNKILIN